MLSTSILGNLVITRIFCLYFIIVDVGPILLEPLKKCDTLISLATRPDEFYSLCSYLKSNTLNLTNIFRANDPLDSLSDALVMSTHKNLNDN